LEEEDVAPAHQVFAGRARRRSGAAQTDYFADYIGGFMLGHARELAMAEARYFKGMA
jgi:hypothetical protein